MACTVDASGAFDWRGRGKVPSLRRALPFFLLKIKRGVLVVSTPLFPSKFFCGQCDRLFGRRDLYFSADLKASFSKNLINSLSFIALSFSVASLPTALLRLEAIASASFWRAAMIALR